MPLVAPLIFRTLRVGLLLAILIGAVAPLSAHAQEVENAASSTNAQKAQEADAPEADAQALQAAKRVAPKVGKSSVVGWLSSFEFWMSFSVLIFGLLVFAIEIVMVRLTSFQPEQTIKLLAVTLIVISTLFIITAGFDSEQIAPAMGLFGTIAGYMLGRASGKSGEVQE